MELKIDQAFGSDAGAIERLYRQLVRHQGITVSSEHLESLRSDPWNYLWVARSEEVVIATAFLTVCRDAMFGTQPFAVLENIVVDTSARHRNVGRSVLQFVEDHCRQMKCTKIMLLSSSARADAHSFFERCGFDGSAKVGFVNYLNRQK